MKVRKLWSFSKSSIRSIFFSKLQLTENHRKLDVSENSQVVYDFLQNELHKDNFMLVKVNFLQFVKNTYTQKQHVER